MAIRNNTFILKRSNVVNKIPVLSGLTLGELALNTADAKLYTLYTGGLSGATEVREIGWDRISRFGDTVAGNFNFYGDITISGSTLPNGYALSVTGDTNFVGDMYVTGDLTYNGDLLVTGGTVIQNGLTANTIYTDYIDFNTNATVPQSEGRISWDSGTGTLNIAVGDTTTGLIDLQVGQEEIVRVFNSEGTTLQKGEIVYVSGSQGNRPAVKRASAVSDGYSVTTLGMVDLAIPSGSEGYVTTFGIISNLNTLGLTGGTPIWLSPTTPGAYTSIKPIAPEHTVLIGYVVRVSATIGSIFVNISNGWELDELHDVRISGATEGDLLIRSSYNGTPVWVNSKTLKGNYTISGNTAQFGNFNITGSTNQFGNLNLQGNLNQIGDFNITGNTNQLGNLLIDGDIIQNGNFNITGNTNQLGDIDIVGNTNQIGDINITGNTIQIGSVDLTGDLFQLGNFNLTGNTYHIGNTNQSGNFILTGHGITYGTLSIIGSSGNTGCTFSVVGNSCFDGDVVVNGNLNYNGDLIVSGATIVEAGFSGNTINITTTPTENNTLYQILGRNEITGLVEYRHVNTIGNNYTYVSGSTYSASTMDNVLGVDTSTSAVTIYLPDSVSSGRLRYEVKDIGLNSFDNNITIISYGSDTIISTENSNTVILAANGGALIIFNTGTGTWLQM